MTCTQLKERSVLNTIDFERCIWDADYRHRVKSLLNDTRSDVTAPANQNEIEPRPTPCATTRRPS